MERIKILNTFIDNLSMKETVEKVDEYVRQGRPLHLMGVNADKINSLNKNRRLKRIVNSCEVINADGASVIWAAKILKKPLKERVAGVDLMERLIALAEKKQYSIFLLGAKQDVVEQTVKAIEHKYPKVRIAGFRNGYFSKKEWGCVAQELKESGAQIIFVGITSPLKEYLVEYLQSAGVQGVFMGVGGSFDVISGKIPRAPLWMQKAGLEWLFRVLQEPGRLWKRYLVGNTRFIISVYREKYRKRSVDKLNILHVSRTMGQGGAEKIVYQLSSGMQKQAEKICVASTGGCYVEKLEEQGISHYEIADLECKKPWIMLQTFFKLWRIVRKEKIEIIHSHHRMAALYASALRVLNPRVKLVYTAHNVFYDKKKFTKMALANTVVVAVGHDVKKNLTDYFNINPKQIAVIYNAVNREVPEERYKNHTLDIWKKQGFSLIGIIGRLSEQKGVDIFLKAAAGLKEKGVRIKGIVIGDGELREELIHQSQALGMGEDVLFLGYQEYVSSLITQLDLVVMPSRWEGFPLLPLEAFAEKKTIVGSDIDGINEIIKDGENGRLVEKDNVEMFEKAVSELLSDVELRRKMEENGFEYYSRKFSYNKFIQQYLKLYKNMLKKREK